MPGSASRKRWWMWPCKIAPRFTSLHASKNASAFSKPCVHVSGIPSGFLARNVDHEDEALGDLRRDQDVSQCPDLRVWDATARTPDLRIRPRAVDRDHGNVIADQTRDGPHAIDRCTRDLIGFQKTPEVPLEAAILQGVLQVDVVVAGHRHVAGADLAQAFDRCTGRDELRLCAWRAV